MDYIIRAGEKFMFKVAKPIFPNGYENELNIFATFHAEVYSLKNAEIHIAAADFYKLYVDGTFVAFGPARAAKGYAREDVISLDGFGVGKHKIAVLVSTYNCSSLSTVKQPGFLLAEIVEGENILCATGRDFVGCLPECRVQKTDRYTEQRHFTEVWDLTKTEMTEPSSPVMLKIYSENETPALLDRRAPYPIYETEQINFAASFGKLEYDKTLPVYNRFYQVERLPQNYGVFKRDEIEYHPYEWVQQHKQKKLGGETALPIDLKEGEYAIFDFDKIQAGFLSFSAHSYADSDIIFAYEERGTKDEFSYSSIGLCNAIEYLLASQTDTETMSFEPYVIKNVMVCVKKGRIRLDSLGVVGVAYDTVGVEIPKIEDETLSSVYRGAIRTFAHNSIDLYMDCPSRERAGWLCDSFFTAKVEYELFGKTFTEDAFLENYRLFENDGTYPDGVLPMCYPSEPFFPVSGKGLRFIPQWTMWYIIEVEDYINNRGHSADKELFRKSIYKLLDFYKRYENEDGLLERLPSWNFVEWSVANDWTNDVNYPTNFLYAYTLECVYKIYGDAECLQKCLCVRNTAKEQSFDGSVFLDHSVRDDNGELVRLDHCSEICQYYAVLFADVDLSEEKYNELRRLIFEVFKAEREEPHPEIAEVNAFIGVYLRLETLIRLEAWDILLRDVSEFFGKMEFVTGTLWELRDGTGSLDHGFASYALVAINAALKRLNK